MGFYPVNPASGVYVVGSPALKKVVLRLQNGNTFTVITHNGSEQNIYIQSVKLNGKDYQHTFITQHDIANGGIIEFTMGREPNKTWGTKMEDRPLNWGF